MASPMGIIPSHKIISSTNYGNISVSDKALGGSALVHISGEGSDIFAKYNRDVTREEISVLKQAGARAGLELGLFSPINPDGTVFGPIDGIRFDGFKMKEMSRADMDEIIRVAALNARLARDFGFDIITYHSRPRRACAANFCPLISTRVPMNTAVRSKTAFDFKRKRLSGSVKRSARISRSNCVSAAI